MTPASAAFLWQVHKRAGVTPDLLQTVIKLFQEFVRKSGADSTGKNQSIRFIVTNQQRAEILAASLWLGVAADNELLLLGQVDFQPGAATPSTFVKRIRPQTRSFWTRKKRRFRERSPKSSLPLTQF